MNNKEHKNPVPTVDVIVQRSNRILLVKRKKDPFKDKLALPGGFVNENETVEDAALREIKEETSLSIELKEILGVYSDPKRDPRGQIMSVVFIGEDTNNDKPQAIAGDDAKEIQWIDINSIDDSNIGFDHSKVLSDYKEWKQNKETYWSTKIK